MIQRAERIVERVVGIMSGGGEGRNWNEVVLDKRRRAAQFVAEALEQAVREALAAEERRA